MPTAREQQLIRDAKLAKMEKQIEALSSKTDLIIELLETLVKEIKNERKKS